MLHNIQSCIFYTILNSLFFFAYVEALIGKKVRNANIREFPYVVSISRKNPILNAQQNHFCTGVIISRSHVLTAAHCLANKTVADVRVIFGSIDLWTVSSYSDLLTWTTYNDWALATNNVIQFPKNDIAMLTLFNPITQREIKAVNLSSLNNKQNERTAGMVAGWGMIDNGTTSRFLLAANVKILTSEACNDKARKYTNVNLRIPEKQLCSTAEPYVLTSWSDSGGPVVNMRNELVGVILGTCPNRSWYQGCDSEEFLKKHKINIHASVDFYREYIESFQ